jgi:hypothetical protein
MGQNSFQFSHCCRNSRPGGHFDWHCTVCLDIGVVSQHQEKYKSIVISSFHTFDTITSIIQQVLVAEIQIPFTSFNTHQFTQKQSGCVKHIY